MRFGNGDCQVAIGDLDEGLWLGTGIRNGVSIKIGIRISDWNFGILIELYI